MDENVIEQSVIEPQDVYDYLGIDDVDSDDPRKRVVERLIGSAESFLTGSLGPDFPKQDSRAKTLALLIVSDLYDNRGMMAQGSTVERVSNTTRKLVHDFSLQLRLEQRGD